MPTLWSRLTNLLSKPVKPVLQESPTVVKLSQEWWAAQVKVPIRYVGQGRCSVSTIQGLEGQVFVCDQVLEVTKEQALALLEVTQPRGGCCGKPAVRVHLFEVA